MKATSHWTDLNKHGDCWHVPNLTESNPLRQEFFLHEAQGNQLVKHRRNQLVKDCTSESEVCIDTYIANKLYEDTLNGLQVV